MTAKELLSKTLVVDGLFHALMKDPPPECGEGRDIVDMVLAGGVNCMVHSIVADGFPTSFAELMNQIYDFTLLQDVIPHKFKIAESVADILAAQSEGKLAFVMSTQGSDCLDGDLRKISLAYKLGLRVLQITYNTECSVGSGSYVKNDKGLTRFGEQASIEMNRVGMVIDLSHVGHTTAWEAMELSQDPVIYSHAGVAALCTHKRNIPDKHIRRLAEGGGVIGLCPHAVMNQREPGRRPTVDDYIDAFLYVADLTGSMDHAGVGTDRWSRNTLANDFKRVGFERTTRGFFGEYDGNHKHVAGFNYYDEWENLVDRMLARGIAPDDVSKLLGGNFLRVFGQVWK